MYEANFSIGDFFGCCEISDGEIRSEELKCT